MKAKILSIFLCLLLLTLLNSACQNNDQLDPDNPITITLWHNYGAQMKDTMDGLVDEFNNTLGKEKGIVIKVTSISSSATLQEKLLAAAGEELGAQKLPNITTCYPKTALMLAQNDLLVNLNTLFTKEDLSDYIPEFLDEGKINDTLYVFPIAKSTEVLFVNQTLFDRFSEETGITLDSLSTFEGIFHAANVYYEWSGGKTFYMPDSWFNFTLIGMEQLGEPLLDNNQLNIQSQSLNYIWYQMYPPSVNGAIAISDSYSSELSKTGDIVCSTGSTAGILFYGDTITYENNVSEKVNYTILPYPTFSIGKKIAIQRGGGMCITKSTTKEEYASGIFLKWFSAPEQNLRFVSSTGYLPVTNTAYNELMETEIQQIDNINIIKLLQVIEIMKNDYTFYIPPNIEEYDSIQKDYETSYKEYVLSVKESNMSISDSYHQFMKDR